MEIFLKNLSGMKDIFKFLKEKNSNLKDIILSNLEEDKKQEAEMKIQSIEKILGREYTGEEH